MPCPNRSLPTHASVMDLPHRTATAHQQQDVAPRPRLLLIGDDDAIADVLAGILDHQGYAVERVVSLQDGLTQVLTPDADGFDVVLTIPVAPGDPCAWLDQLLARAELEAALQAAHRGEQKCAQLLIRAEEAEGALQVRDDVLSAVSHDLRAPLTSMMGHTDFLLGRLDHDEALAPEFARLHLTALLQATRR